MKSFIVLLNASIFALGAVACSRESGDSSTESAKFNQDNKRDRGPCTAQLSNYSVKAAFKREFQGNIGRVHGNAMKYEDGLGYNYGDKVNSELLVTLCRGSQCINMESTQGFFQLWKKFAQFGEKKLSIELFPERTPYEMKVTLDDKTAVAKCPNWDDPK